jgi:SAM-dependent methyltransferase
MQVREMMFGHRDVFTYLTCDTCGCLQIAEPDIDFEKYYPEAYYSFNEATIFSLGQQQSPLQRLKRRAVSAAVNATARSRARFLGSPGTRAWLARRPVAQIFLDHVSDPHARILDVGCGTGKNLDDLYHLQYQRLAGCDPFIAKDLTLGGKCVIRKAALAELDGTFDCISLHHVLEHIGDQAGTLRAAAARLAASGIIIVRIPISDSTAAQTYQQDWVQLDAPRHLVLHSKASFALVVQQAGLRIDQLYCDSTAFQFWGSELYRRDITLSQYWEAGSSLRAFFSAAQLAEFDVKATALNASGDGDQVVAILRAA